MSFFEAKDNIALHFFEIQSIRLRYDTFTFRDIFFVYSLVPNCRGKGGGGQTANFWEKNPSSSFASCKRMT